MTDIPLQSPLIECIPNLSEGRNADVIEQLTEVIRNVDGVKLLHTDVGYSANRTVFTFAGSPDAVVEAAYNLIEKASQLIDMSKHHGTHPRIGAVDVCPLVPVSGITMEETVAYSYTLAKLVGNSLGLPVYCYDKSAQTPQRKALESIRKGEYEGLRQKMSQPEWKPDFGPLHFNQTFGAVVIGARNFLIAYNINLSTHDVAIAHSIAAEIRESGRIVTREQHGERLSQRIPGKLKAVKAIGWYEEKYGCAQISTNLVDFRTNSIVSVFETVKQVAANFGVEVTGSEIIGLIPLQAILKPTENYKLTLSDYNEIFISNAISVIENDILLQFDAKNGLKTKILEFNLKNRGC